jgi:hypothetical protein
MSTKNRLDPATFERLLQVHGSRIERWPEALREPLERWLESSEGARARWAEASELDAWLDAVPEIEPASDLVARIASLPALHARPERLGWWPFGNPLAPLLAWGAAAALGVALGVLVAPELDLELDSADDADAVAEVLASDGDGADDDGADGDGADDEGADDWVEVSGLVMGADWVPEDE